MACSCRHLQRLKKARIHHDERSSVYMDYNATTPPDRRVLGVFQNTAASSWAHPSSPHLAGAGAEERLDRCLTELKELTGGHYGEADFCGSGTEALFAGMAGAAAEGGRRIITSRGEHSALLNIARQIGGRDHPPVLLPVDGHGKIRNEALTEALEDNPRALVVYSPVNHETGAVQDCRGIAGAAAETGALVFLDAVQAAARLNPADWMPWGDMACISGHKIYGLKGTAVLLRKEGLSLTPFRPGGSEALFPGTPDTAGAAALTEALKIHLNRLEEDRQVLASLTADGLRILRSGSFETVLHTPEDGVPGVLCLSLPGVKDMEELFYHLNREGICLSRFSACMGSVNGSSRILDAMGISPVQSESSLRISLGRESRREHFFRLKQALEEFFASAAGTAP